MVLTTPFHPRLAELNTAQLWGHWAGHLSATQYTTAPKHEYFGVRNAVGLFDASPLHKYAIAGRDAEQFLGGIFARDIRTCRPGAGAVHGVVRRPRIRPRGRRGVPPLGERLPPHCG